MKTPQQFITEWALVNDHKIFVHLDKEQYWLVWTDKPRKTWNFEHNQYSNVPNYAYNKIKQVLRKAGYDYYAE